MTHDLFDLNSEFILRDLEVIEEGLTVNGKLINNIRYTDDTVVFAFSETGLQTFLNAVQVSGKKFGLSLNINQTMTML